MIVSEVADALEDEQRLDDGQLIDEEQRLDDGQLIDDDGQPAPIVILDSPASPSTHPPSQPQWRSGTADIILLAEAATAASLATRSIAPEAADALQALADAARRIGDTAAGSRLAIATTAAATSEDGAAASGAAAFGDGAAASGAAASGDIAAGDSVGASSSAQGPSSAQVSSSHPPYFAESSTCVVCMDEMIRPGITNGCGHRSTCRRCLWEL